MAELHTEPGWKPASASRRPWWATALLAGIGTGAALAAALGLSSMQARGSEQPPPVRSAGMSMSAPESGRLDRIEQRLGEISERLARIEGRMERK